MNYSKFWNKLFKGFRKSIFLIKDFEASASNGLKEFKPINKRSFTETILSSFKRIVVMNS